MVPLTPGVPAMAMTTGELLVPLACDATAAAIEFLPKSMSRQAEKRRGHRLNTGGGVTL